MEYHIRVKQSRANNDDTVPPECPFAKVRTLPLHFVSSYSTHGHSGLWAPDQRYRFPDEYTFDQNELFLKKIFHGSLKFTYYT